MVDDLASNEPDSQYWYESPVSLSQPFGLAASGESEGAEGEKRVKIHRYFARNDDGAAIALITPLGYFRKTRVAVYEIEEQETGDKLGVVSRKTREFLDVTYFGAEEVTREFLKTLYQINEVYFRDLKLVPSKRAMNLELLTAENAEALEKRSWKRALFFHKNYLVVPLSLSAAPSAAAPLQELLWDICGLRLQRQKDLALLGQLHAEGLGESEKAAEAEKRLRGIVAVRGDLEAAGRHVIVLDALGLPCKTSFRKYFQGISKLVYRYRNENGNIRNYFDWMFAMGYVSTQKFATNLVEFINNHLKSCESPSKLDFLAPLRDLGEYQENQLALFALETLRYDDLDYGVRENRYQKQPEETLVSAEFLRRMCLPPSRVKLAFLSELRPTFLSFDNVFAHMKLLTVLPHFERAVSVREFQRLFALPFIALPKLQNALTGRGADDFYNYENLESLGDSALKLIISLEVMQRYPNDGPSKLSFQRSAATCNDKLEAVAKEKKLGRFARVGPLTTKNYLPAQLVIESENAAANESRPQIIGKKAHADLVEAILGAALIREGRLFEAHAAMRALEILVGSDLWPARALFSEPFGLTPKEIDELVRLRMAKTESYTSLTRKVPMFKRTFDGQAQVSSMDPDLRLFHFCEYLKILKLSVRRPKELVRCFEVAGLEFERLEFLGDAVIEVYTLLLFHQISTRLKQIMFPLNFHTMKVILLSTETLSRLFLILGLQTFIRFPSKSDTAKLETAKQFAESFSPEEEFKQLWYSERKLPPKVIADAFEAFVGGLFLDGGWPLVKQLLDPLFARFICFYARFHLEIVGDMKGDIINKFQEKGIKVEFQTRNRETVLLYHSEGRLVNVISKGGADSKINEYEICTEFFKNPDKYLPRKTFKRVIPGSAQREDAENNLYVDVSDSEPAQDNGKV